MIHKVLNFLAFQVAWFANVLGAAHGVPWAGPALTLVWLAAHVAALRGDAAPELRLVLAGAALGWMADSTLVLAGLVAFPSTAQLGGPSPVWMVALWASFAATFRHALGWLRERFLLGAAFGAVGGPAAYLAGEALGAIALSGGAAVLAVSVQYALATPALLAMVRFVESGRGATCEAAVPEVRQ